jgi:predicted metal-dependent phosphoesterase TrpH
VCNIDLHTHSVASPDGGLNAADYRRMLANGHFACVAITDHNTTVFAEELYAELGRGIIVGEEITTTQGEIIGLYLKRTVPGGISLVKAVQSIKEQGGLVYVPHPFETRRKGLSLEALATIAGDVDIVETHNGRAVFQNRSKQARSWAAEHDLPGASSSDAHGLVGWGRTYSVLAAPPTRQSLVHLLHSAQHKSGSPGLRGVLYPKYNRLRKKGASRA